MKQFSIFKQFSISHLLLVVLLSGAACSGIRTVDVSYPAIPASRLKDNAGDYSAKLHKEGLLVKFEKGDTIPVAITSQLPFATLTSGENQFVFARPTFVFLNKEGLFISPDGKKFAPIYNTRALKKLYNARQGTFSIGFSLTKDSGAQIKADFSLE
ncbi:MAG: hypothetical protein JXR76_21505 [Deltaproteobacteria bacterium]|nr:hypothetical protein [Deltaproteobacteria bacterium]